MGSIAEVEHAGRYTRLFSVTSWEEQVRQGGRPEPPRPHRRPDDRGAEAQRPPRACRCARTTTQVGLSRPWTSGCLSRSLGRGGMAPRPSAGQGWTMASTTPPRTFERRSGRVSGEVRALRWWLRVTGLLTLLGGVACILAEPNWLPPLIVCRDELDVCASCHLFRGPRGDAQRSPSTASPWKPPGPSTTTSSW